MSNTISPNMGLVVPGIGTENSPTWATDLNASLAGIDSHNHSPGQGVQISPNGMNINSDLAFQNNNATALRAARFFPQPNPISNSGADVGELYVAGNELYYNDVTGGHVIQVTNNGSVNAGAGSISGLPSGTASASYNAGTFVWQSATSTPANMDFGSAVLRNFTANSKGLTLSPPVAMSSDYTITLPSLAASTLPLVMDTSGNILPSQITYAQLAPSLQNMVSKAPTIQIFTSGSGTYTTPSGVNYLKVRMVGGGGGGAGNDGSGGGVGGDTAFGTSLLIAGGGDGGAVQSGSGSAGTATINSPAVGLAITGGRGGAGFGFGGVIPQGMVGGVGASSALGGAGGAGRAFAGGGDGTVNTGGGGGGAGGGANTGTGGGGASGGFVDAIVYSPGATYSYSIGVGGAPGNGTFTGGAGGSGIIIVEEHYGS